MSRISPLQNAHNKGLFGDYQEKTESNLLKIREITDVKIYQVKDKIIVGEKNKKIIIKKTGIGEKIYQWAQNDPAYYGIVCILFAIFAGLVGATAFRRL